MSFPKVDGIEFPGRIEVALRAIRKSLDIRQFDRYRSDWTIGGVLASGACMKTDTLLYRLFQTIPETFFLALGMSATEAAKAAKAYDFRAVELKETTRRLDGVLIPKEPGRILFFTEIQFYKLESIYAEIMAKGFTYLAQNDPGHPFLAVVIFGSRSFEPTNPRFYGPLMGIGMLRPVFLDEIPETPAQPLGLSILRLVVQAEATSVALGRELIGRVAAEIGDEAERVNLIELIGEAVIRKLSKLTREEVEVMLGLHDIRETRVFQDARKEGVEEGLEKGLEKGREEGREEIRRQNFQEKVRLVGQLAEFQLPPERIAEMAGLDVAKVREILTSKLK